MRKLLLLFLILLSGCSYKIIRDYQLPEGNKSADDCKPWVVDHKNLYGLNLKLIGTVRVIAPEFLSRCADDKAMEKLTREACQAHSNLVNIIFQGVIQNTNCDSYEADLYEAEFNNTITEILKKQDRTLVKYNDVKDL